MEILISQLVFQESLAFFRDTEYCDITFIKVLKGISGAEDLFILF